MKLFSRPAATNELIIDTFAAAPVDMTTAADSAFARDVVTVGKRMNTRGWSWYKKIGEIHYAVGRSALPGTPSWVCTNVALMGRPARRSPPARKRRSPAG